MRKRSVVVCLGVILGFGWIDCGRAIAAETAAVVPKVGDHIEAIDINQKWVNATVVKVEGTKLFVQFEGKTDYWNDWVTADRYRIAGAKSDVPKQPAGKRVEALDFNTQWTDATVLKVDGQKSLVHFDGKSDYWDQWVGPERIRPEGTTNALALQHPAPEQQGKKGLEGWVAGTKISAQNAYECRGDDQRR